MNALLFYFIRSLIDFLPFKAQIIWTCVNRVIIHSLRLHYTHQQPKQFSDLIQTRVLAVHKNDNATNRSPVYPVTPKTAQPLSDIFKIYFTADFMCWFTVVVR